MGLIGPYLGALLRDFARITGIELLMSHVKTRKRVLNPVNYCPIRCGLRVLKLWSMNIVLWSTCIRHLNKDPVLVAPKSAPTTAPRHKCRAAYRAHQWHTDWLILDRVLTRVCSDAAVKAQYSHAIACEIPSPQTSSFRVEFANCCNTLTSMTAGCIVGGWILGFVLILI